jgi:hypothetical protein
MTEESTELQAALETERQLREQIADLIHARSRASDEARRLAERARIPNADTVLAQLRDRYQRQTEMLSGEIEELRKVLRAAEAVVERLRAQEAGA